MIKLFLRRKFGSSQTPQTVADRGHSCEWLGCCTASGAMRHMIPLIGLSDVGANASDGTKGGGGMKAGKQAWNNFNADHCG